MWESVATEIIGEAVYYAGNFSDDSTLAFPGCGPVSNPANSWQDAFLAKFVEGECQWMRTWESGRTGRGDKRSKTAMDLAQTPAGHVVIAVKTFFQVQYVGPGATGSRVIEIDSQGNTVWKTMLSAKQGTTVSYEAVDASEDGLSVAGWHNRDIGFASSTLTHHSGDEEETMVLQWSQSSTGARSELWGVTFGGSGSNIPADIAADNLTGDIAVVGNYDDQHTHLDNTSADQATNNSFYIQTMDRLGNHRAADASPNQSSNPDYTEFMTSADFNDAGELFVAGHLHGKIDKNWPATGNDYTFDGDNSGADEDYFVVRFADASSLANNSAWRTESDWNQSNTTSPKITLERVHELTATEDYVAITGQVCDASVECERDGFAHIFDFNQSYPLHPSSYSGYTVTYQNSGDGFWGDSIDHESGRFAVGGTNTDTNYSLGGGQLPGGYDFLAGYGF